MGLSIVEYRLRGVVTKVVFIGEFFTNTPQAEFNRMLALALFGQGVNLGILNRGPRDLDGTGDSQLKLLEELEKNLPGDADWCLCWEKEENIGLSRVPIFRLVNGSVAAGKDEYAYAVAELKPSGVSWQEIAQSLLKRLETLQAKPQRYEISGISFVSCFFTEPTEDRLVEKTRSSLKLAGIGIEPQVMPLETILNAHPEDRVFLVEEGETLHAEDKEAFEKSFFSLREHQVFLEVVSLDPWGLEHLVVPSLRFLRGRTFQSAPVALDSLPFLHRGQWAPVRVHRPRFLAQKRWEGLARGKWEQVLPAYHYHHLLAVAAVAIGKPKEAITAFQAAYREAPEPYRALVLRNLSLALISQGRYEEALGILQDGKKLYPAYTDLGYLAGLAYWKQRCYDDALQECFKAVLEKGEATNWHYSDPGVGSYKPAFLIAEIYREKGKFEDAVTSYIGSLTHNPYFLPALEKLGRMALDDYLAGKVLDLLSTFMDLDHPEVSKVYNSIVERYSSKLK